ncbi:hypothetical protein F4825DRAFT_402092 [Nemania diffusa]|nr:hypothetical protein F4825DRAFT_402092 [Nemania diffusa]
MAGIFAVRRVRLVIILTTAMGVLCRGRFSQTTQPLFLLSIKVSDPHIFARREAFTLVIRLLASSSTTVVQPTNHTLTPSPPPSPSPHTSNIAPGGTIAGAVVGGVAGITIITGLIWWVCMRKKIGSSESVNKVSQHIHESSKGRNQYREHPSMLIIQRPAEIDGNPKSELLETTDRTEGRSEML